jgi:hypothetical protein
MGNALAMFDDKKMALPAHLRDLNEEGNIQERNSVPSLSITGKVFEISVNGDKKKLVKVDEDGDEIPLSVFRAIILDYAKKRGRAYYEGAYDASAVKQPTCWSEDGVVPHASVPEDQKQCSKCESCPMAVKGSRLSDGDKPSKMSACGQHRMVVLIPANNLAHPPLRLKLAVTSDWDKNEEWAAQGFFGFSNYTDFLRTKGVKHTAALVTKLKFDPNEAYPKLLFSPDKWLTPEQIDVIKPVLASDEVKQLVSGAFTPAGADGKPTGGEDAAPAPKAAATKPKAAPAPALADDDEEEQPAVVAAPARKPKAAPVTLDGEDEDVKVATPPKKTKPAPVATLADDDDEEEAAPAPAPKKKLPPSIAIADDEDEDEAPLVAKPVAAKAQAAKKPVDKAPAKAAQATTSVPDDVNELLDEWTD